MWEAIGAVVVGLVVGLVRLFTGRNDDATEQELRAMEVDINRANDALRWRANRDKSGVRLPVDEDARPAGVPGGNPKPKGDPPAV